MKRYTRKSKKAEAEKVVTAEAIRNEIVSNATNGAGHLGKASKYAHFSRITKTNQHLFPKFAQAQTKALKFIVYRGDSLFIPKGWWHWVESKVDHPYSLEEKEKRCIAISMWFNAKSNRKNKEDEIEEDENKQPRVLQGCVKDWPAISRWTNRYLQEKIDEALPNGVWLWLKESNFNKPITFKMFLELYAKRNSGNILNANVFAYLITLSDYELDQKNNHTIVDVLKDDFKVPQFIIDNINDENDIFEVSKVTSNFWMNFGDIDTGLHYDDEDGLLSVVDGYKEVTLYPPSESDNIYPYSLEGYKLRPFRQKFMYNVYKSLPGIVAEGNLCSSDLLNLTLELAPEVMSIACKFQDKYGEGKIVWSCKNNNGSMQWEFYFYGFTTRDDIYQSNRQLFNKDSTGDYNSDFALHSYLDFHRSLFPNDNYTLEKIEDTIDLHGLCIYSIDLTEDGALRGTTPCLNLYHTRSTKIQLPLVLNETTYYSEKENQSSKIVPRSKLISFLPSTSLEIIATSLGLSESDMRMITNFIASLNYTYKSCCIINKNSVEYGCEIGVYLFGITTLNFQHFLHSNAYSGKITSFVSTNFDKLHDIEHEVAFHLRKNSDRIQNPIVTRTAFYGIF